MLNLIQATDGHCCRQTSISQTIIINCHTAEKLKTFKGYWVMYDICYNKASRFLRYNKISHYSEINKRPRDKTGGHTRVNERAQNRQSEAAGRLKCAGVMAGRD